MIPANVTGTWEWDMPGEKERYVLKLSQQFQKVSGMLRLGSDEIPVKNLELKGDWLQFTVEQFFKGQKQTLRFIGRVQDHLIEGTARVMADGFPGAANLDSQKESFLHESSDL